MVVNGWTLLFHATMRVQVSRLCAAAERARKSHPKNFASNPNVKLFTAAMKLMLELIPADPGRAEYRQGNMLGASYRHWFRAKFAGRFRLFFRYDSRDRIIVFGWLNDERTLRQRGGRRDPYEVFRRMLSSGNPPDEWRTLVRTSRELPRDLLPPGRK